MNTTTTSAICCTQVKTAATMITFLQSELAQRTAERDALQEQVDDYGEPEQLSDDLAEMQDEVTELKVEREGLKNDLDDQIEQTTYWQEQHTDLEEERDELLQERDALQDQVKEWTECLEEERDEAADKLAVVEKERDALKTDITLVIAAAAKPTPPPVAPRKKATPSLTITQDKLNRIYQRFDSTFTRLAALEERLDEVETENDQLRTGMH